MSQPDTSRRKNRLANATSPYLLQHADNPVDWFEWGDEAFAEARRRDVPIFLSIGYSACHWCHVMEHESFDNPEIAALMNEKFVNIKVDREERPDLDQIYMNAVMAMTGRGGWPMSVFLTHDLKPFYCGTYWPPEQRFNMPGFRQILTRISEAWKTRRADIEQSAQQLAEAVAQMCQPRGDAETPDTRLLAAAMSDLLQAADTTWGGFGSAPKFPHPMDLRLLLRCQLLFQSDEAGHIVSLTCNRMANGGIYDQLGGGFARYSTDAQWLVPHFEKMLYDNALLLSVYAELYQHTEEPFCVDVIKETVAWVQREMVTAEGGFCSSQDADSEGEEGRYFVWTKSEVEDVLGPQAAPLFCAAFDVSEGGNWEGKNILRRIRSDAELAEEFDMPPQTIAQELRQAKRALFERRLQRVAPATDDKVVTAWNGMMISGLSLAARAIDSDTCVELATRAADFLLTGMTDSTGRLYHTSRHGRCSVPAFLDDYACLIDALIELYQTTLDEKRIEQALGLSDIVLSDFATEEKGAFRYTAKGQSTPVAIVKDCQDGATPSGNSMLATAFLKLGTLCHRDDLTAAAEQILQALTPQLRRAPMSGGQALLAVFHALSPRPIVAIRSDVSELGKSKLLEPLRHRFFPNVLSVLRSPHMHPPEVCCAALNAHFAGHPPGVQHEQAWICTTHGCLPPVQTVQDEIQQLAGVCLPTMNTTPAGNSDTPTD